MVALYDYNPRLESPNPTPELELSFKKGQTITVFGNKVTTNMVANSNVDILTHTDG